MELKWKSGTGWLCGIKCGFNDMRIDRSTIPERKYLYEAVGDDDSGGDTATCRVYDDGSMYGG